MLLGQLDSLSCAVLLDVSTLSDAAGRSRQPEKRYTSIGERGSASGLSAFLSPNKGLRDKKIS